MKRRTLILLFIYIAIILITIDTIREYNKRKEQKIIYRYIPRTFNEEMDFEVPITKIYNKMFTQPSPWIAGINSIDERKHNEINKYFVSQM